MTLQDQELHQLMEDLHQEITLCELHAPPAILNQLLGGKPSGSGTFDGDDPEVTFPRGGGWVPPRQPSPTPVPA